jgi:hypothetical protein
VLPTDVLQPLRDVLLSQKPNDAVAEAPFFLLAARLGGQALSGPGDPGALPGVGVHKRRVGLREALHKRSILPVFFPLSWGCALWN